MAIGRPFVRMDTPNACCRAAARAQKRKYRSLSTPPSNVVRIVRLPDPDSRRAQIDANGQFYVEGRRETQSRRYCAIHGCFHDDTSFINEQLMKSPSERYCREFGRTEKRGKVAQPWPGASLKIGEDEMRSLAAIIGVKINKLPDK